MILEKTPVTPFQVPITFCCLCAGIKGLELHQDFLESSYLKHDLRSQNPFLESLHPFLGHACSANLYKDRSSCSIFPDILAFVPKLHSDEGVK